LIGEILPRQRKAVLHEMNMLTQSDQEELRRLCRALEKGG
jgi:hypothetical protein